MSKIYLKATVRIIVRADEGVSLEDLSEHIRVSCSNDDPEDRFDIEDWGCQSLEVEDSK
jgi:hypothetical protein